MGMPMTSNSFERMKIVIEMVDIFDNDEFIRICETEKVYPLSMNEYAMKAGFVMMAMVKYPDMTIEEAYMNVVADANNQQAKDCFSCGKKEDKPLPGMLTQAKN